MSVDTRLEDDTGTAEDGATADASPGRGRASRATLMAFVALTVVVSAWAVAQTRQVLHDREQERAGRAAVEVARTQTLNMLSVSPDNVDSRMRTLLANSTGEFRRDFESVQQSFGAVVTKGEVVSTAHVVSSALAEQDDHDARVLLAVDSEVRNGKRQETQSRQYRLIADLTRKGERWLISGMRFVA